MAAGHRCARHCRGLWVPRESRKAVDELCPPAPPHTVPGEEVQDLLLAAGDGGQRLHDGTGCPPRGLRRRREEHLQAMGEKPLAQMTDSLLHPVPSRAKSPVTHAGEVF